MPPALPPSQYSVPPPSTPSSSLRTHSTSHSPRHRSLLSASSLLLLAACLPDVDADLTRVDAPRILAVAADPAEVAPGKLATFTALHADADGTLTTTKFDWALCTARRPLAELGPVDPACVARKDDDLIALPAGVSTLGKLPQDACRLFGPEPPPAAPGEPSGRPVDPDPSGGYYQPLRVFDPDSDDAPTLLRVRLACGLAGADQQQSAEFRRRYLANLAPAVTLEQGDTPITDTITVAPGEELPLRARWTACPDTAECGDALCSPGEPEACPADCAIIKGCPGAETYLRFDPATLSLTEQREAISVAWYATAGTFSSARTGRAADDHETFTQNPWTAPDDPGPVTLWVVIRDDRGAVAWHTADITVEAP